MAINIAGTVPPKDVNGMYDLEEAWQSVEDPTPITAIVTIERSALNLPKGKPRKPVMTFTSIEPLLVAEDAAAAQDLLTKARAARTGEAPLYEQSEIDLPDEPEPDFETPLEEQPLEDDDEERASEPDEDGPEDGFEPEPEDEEVTR